MSCSVILSPLISSLVIIFCQLLSLWHWIESLSQEEISISKFAYQCCHIHLITHVTWCYSAGKGGGLFMNSILVDWRCLAASNAVVSTLQNSVHHSMVSHLDLVSFASDYHTPKNKKYFQAPFFGASACHKRGTHASSQKDRSVPRSTRMGILGFTLCVIVLIIPPNKLEQFPAEFCKVDLQYIFSASLLHIKFVWV